MYKTHFKLWGLAKNNKEPEMRAIVRKHKERADQGKASAIHVRGQIRTIMEAFHYWERKGVSIDELIARRRASPTPEAVKFFTPLPSPILTPQVLAIPECMFRSIRDYIKGSFESGMWYSADPVNHCCSIKVENNTRNDMVDLVLECSLACSLSQMDLSYEAGQTLSKAIRKIKQVLLADHPTTLTIFLYLIQFLRSEEKAEMALAISQKFSVMAKALLGSEHPLSRICEWYDGVYESDYGDIVIRCVEIVTSHFESLVGPLHASTLYSRIYLIRIGTQSRRARVQQFQRLLGECENTLRPEDPRMMEVRFCTADECLWEGRYDDALSFIQTNTAHHQAQSSKDAGYSSDLCYLAMCQHALGEVDLGIATLHQAVDVRTSILGTQEADGMRWLLLLEEWYTEQGLWDDAALAHELSLISLKSVDGD